MRTWASVAFVALLLAGCSGSGGDSSSSGGATSATTGITSSGIGVPGNHPPTGGIAASVASGDVPLKVNFTLDGADQDKDPLTWTLDFQGDGTADKTGTAMPATAEFTYNDAGTFNVTYRISDAKSEVTFHVAITAKATGPPPAPFTPITFTQTEPAPCLPCDQTSDASGCVGWLQGVQAVDCGWTELPASASGHKWTATGTVDVGVMFYEACDPNAAIIIMVDGNLGDEEGTVPEGALCVLLFGAEAPAQTVSIDIT